MKVQFKFKFCSSITVINAHVCVYVYILVTRNGKERQPEFHSRTRLSPAQVCSDARNPRFEESWISKARLVRECACFHFHPRRFIAGRIVISRVQAFPFILRIPSPLPSPLLSSTCFTAINVPPNRGTRHPLSFINSPDKLIHEAGDGLINLPLPLHNDRWIVETRGPSSGRVSPPLARTVEQWNVGLTIILSRPEERR